MARRFGDDPPSNEPPKAVKASKAAKATKAVKPLKMQKNSKSASVPKGRDKSTIAVNVDSDDDKEFDLAVNRVRARVKAKAVTTVPTGTLQTSIGSLSDRTDGSTSSRAFSAPSLVTEASLRSNIVAHNEMISGVTSRYHDDYLARRTADTK